MSQVNLAVRTTQPAVPLRRYISHYWLSPANNDTSYSIVPDGSVDVVLVIRASSCQIAVFGTTTKKTDVMLEIGSHYLGIRFRPGQSRHFMQVNTAELTDAIHTADDVLLPDLSQVTQVSSMDLWFALLDAILMQHLRQTPPCHARIDEVIRYIEASNHPLQVAELADLYCRSRRQFERTFLTTAGLPAKQFLQISRFRRAYWLLAHSAWSLSQIATMIGYSDQSHFTHEFSRFFGVPPSKARADVAFVQDLGLQSAHNGNSLYIR